MDAMQEDAFRSLGCRVTGRLKGFLQDDTCLVVADEMSLGALKWNGSSLWLPYQRARLVTWSGLQGLPASKKLKRLPNRL